jgi:hypothetical protein
MSLYILCTLSTWYIYHWVRLLAVAAQQGAAQVGATQRGREQVGPATTGAPISGCAYNWVRLQLVGEPTTGCA